MAANCIIFRLPGNGIQQMWGQRLLAGADRLLSLSCEKGLPGLGLGWSPQGGLRGSFSFWGGG